MAKDYEQKAKKIRQLLSFPELWAQLTEQLQRSGDRITQKVGFISRYLDTELFVPDCEFKERQNDYCFSLDLPGVYYRDIHIEMVGRQLRIYGRRPKPSHVEAKLFRHEKAYGSFERSITLPDMADIDNVTATYEDGVLDVWIQKLANHPPKVIPVNRAALDDEHMKPENLGNAVHPKSSQSMRA